MSSGEDLKSSAHVWGGGNGPDSNTIEDSPPAYSGTAPETDSVPETSSAPARNSAAETSSAPKLPLRPRQKPVPKEPYNPIQAISRWAKIPWNKYVVPDAVVSADRTTITTNHPLYLSSLQALIKVLSGHAELPPIPMLRIAGSHTTNSVAGYVTDFDLLLNLSPLLDLSKSPRLRIRAQVVPLSSPDGKSRASTSVSNDSIQLDMLARQFLRDKSDRKSFVLTKTIDNLPTDVIEGLVRNLMAAIQYRGKLVVSFPTQCGQFVVQKKPAGAGAAVGGWFMNVLGLSPDVKYETLERIWEVGSPSFWATEGSSSMDVDQEQTSAHGDASALVKEWWQAWAPCIQDSVLLKRKGKVGIEDWMETQMGWRPALIAREWGVDNV